MITARAGQDQQAGVCATQHSFAPSMPGYPPACYELGVEFDGLRGTQWSSHPDQADEFDELGLSSGVSFAIDSGEVGF